MTDRVAELSARAGFSTNGTAQAKVTDVASLVALIAWDCPLPLEVIGRPDFPLAVLPADLNAFVEGLAGATQTPPALAAMMTDAAIGAAAAKNFEVAVSGDWIEPINGYTLTVLPSGERKTAVVNEVTAPFENWERDQRLADQAKIAEAENDRTILEKRLERAQREAASSELDKARPAEAEAKDVAKLLATTAVPARTTLLADDCTPEAVPGLLAENGGRIAFLLDEGGIFDLIAGKYTQGVPSLDVFLRGYDGGTVRPNRVGRGSQFIPHAAITMGLAVQPEVLLGLAEKPGFRGKGLLARFDYALPVSLLGRRATQPTALAATARTHYHALITHLLKTTPATDDAGAPRPHRLTLSEDAATSFRAFIQRIEPQLGPDGELAGFTDWGGKLAGKTARRAGRLHLAVHAGHDAPWPSAIAERTMAAAITIAEDFLIPHATAAFAEMGSAVALSDARVLLRWIRRQGDAQTVTRADAYRSLRRNTRFPAPEDLEPAFKVLTDLGYLVKLPADPQTGPGRPGSTRFAVHPKLAEIRDDMSTISTLLAEPGPIGGF